MLQTHLPSLPVVLQFGLWKNFDQKIFYFLVILSIVFFMISWYHNINI